MNLLFLISHIMHSFSAAWTFPTSPHINHAPPFIHFNCYFVVTFVVTFYRQALQRLTEAAEKAKIELSALPQTSINLPFITATADGPKHIDTTLSRAQFEKLCSDLLERVKRPVEQSLRDAKLDIKDINEVILVGGSTRIPAVQDVVKGLTGKDPNVTVNPDEVVALGAAVQAGVLAGEVFQWWPR